MPGRSPDFDDAVVPLRHQRCGISFDGRGGTRRGRCGGDGGNLRIPRGQIEHGLPAGNDIHDLRPRVSVAAERDRPIGFDGVASGCQLELDHAAGVGAHAPRLVGRRIVADEQNHARQRHGPACGVGQHHAHAQCGALAGNR